MSKLAAVQLPVTFTVPVVAALGQPLTAAQRSVNALTKDEVLVRVQYSSINPMDKGLQMHNFFQMPLPIALGFDYSGTVAAVGSSAGTQLAVGDEVFGFSTSGGCFGDYIVVNHALVLKRGAIPAAEAGAYGVAFCSAYEPLLLVEDISKRKGQTIYIAGGGGGVGHFAVQLAKLHGLKVISSGSKPASLQLLSSLQVDHVIDYSKQDVVQEVLKLTDGKGVDVVYDPSYSPASFTQSAAVVASGGVWLRLGAWQGQDAKEAEVRAIVESRGAKFTYGDFGRFWANPEYQPKMPVIVEALRGTPELYQQGKLKVRVTSTVGNEPKQLQQAIDDLSSQKLNVGKVAVKVGA